MKKHLRWNSYSAWDSGQNLHPQIAMAELGITYQEATPQTVCDEWWFWNCENIPTKLPEYLSELDVNPHDAIGHGLDKKLADEIAAATDS